MPTRVPFPWPFKGVNHDWPSNAQPTLSTPDALNVLSDEPQRGRSRGGSRAGTVKAVPDQLGDGTSRRIGAFAQVTTVKIVDDVAGGTSSGLYQTITNQATFSQSDGTHGALEDSYVAWSVGDHTAAFDDPVAAFQDRIGGGRSVTVWNDPTAPPMHVDSGSLLAIDVDDAAAVAAWQDGNYTNSDSFQVEATGSINGADSYAFVACRVKNGDPTTTSGVLILQITFDGDTTFTFTLWQGTTLIDSITGETELGGAFRAGLRVVGDQVSVMDRGVVIYTRTVISTASHRGVAFGAYRDPGGTSSVRFAQFRALGVYAGVDWSSVSATDDFSTYTSGLQLETVGPFDVGTATVSSSIANALPRLDGHRGGDADNANAGVAGDDGNPFAAASTTSAPGTEMAIVRRTGDLTPADAFEVRLVVDRTSTGRVPWLMARIKDLTPTDDDGVITAAWMPAVVDEAPEFVLFVGTDIVARGTSSAGGVPNDGTLATVRCTLKLRVEGELVTFLVDDYVVCSATVAGQNASALSVAFGGPYADFDGGEIAKVRSLDVYTQDAGGDLPGQQTRDVRFVAVVGEDVYTGRLGEDLTKIDNVRTTQRRPHLTDINGLVYMVDATPDVKVIDPVAGTAVTLVASAGAVPTNCNIACNWRARLILSGQIDTPQNLYMSAAGDPTDFDYSPTTPSAIQAVALNASEAGRIGQPVVALIPFKDDVLIIGCDHAIYALTGDPAAGGALDAVSEAIGILTRESWTLAPDGTIYFVGTGGFYRMAPGGAPQDLSTGKVARAFRDLDRDANGVVCVWDRDRHGCWIFITPRVDGAASTHYWFDARQMAFWPMRFPTNQGPIAAMVYDADAPADRQLLLGGFDGYIRRLDVEADQDDGVAIESFCFLGPVNPGGAFENAKIIETEITTGQPTNGIDYELHVGSDAQTALASAASFSGRFTTYGRQDKVRSRARGNTFLYRVGNTLISKAWTLERVDGIFEASGRQR